MISEETNKTILRISMKNIKSINYWMEGFRDPTKQPQFIIIEKIETGIGQAVKAYIETEKDQGVWKNFIDYESW